MTVVVVVTIAGPEAVNGTGPASEDVRVERDSEEAP